MDKPSVVRNAALSLFNRKGLAYNTTRAEMVKQFADELLRAIDTEEFRENLYQFYLASWLQFKIYMYKNSCIALYED